MKRIKSAFWIIVIGFLALLIMQNQDFFFSKSSFNLDFYYRKYITPELPNAVLFLAFFLSGLLIAYMFNLMEQFKAKKTQKNLNATLQAQMEVISSLKSEITAKDSKIEQLSKSQPAAQVAVEPPENLSPASAESSAPASQTTSSDNSSAFGIPAAEPIGGAVEPANTDEKKAS